MASIGADAGGVSHGMGDVVLLVDPMQQVGHGPTGKHSHILAAVGLLPQWHGRLRLVVSVCWGKTAKVRII